MSRTRHERASELFAAARRLEGRERERYLDEACPDDAALRAAVQALLDEHEQTAGLFDTASVRVQLGGAAADALSMPHQIAQYRIIRMIGEGGMGNVYEAEQDDPRRRVALKVLRHGVISRRMLARFRHEAQVLGQLKHPGIAQIHAAGTSDQGDQPYFVMELVTGRSLLDDAEARGLGTRDRLELIARIADALHHAHLKGVIHRDLKPMNILVDESGQPKILDFGVARATDADIQTVTAQTDVGELVGTVPYMSPEQASGNPDELDIRSDLYSLGVITFQLLGGRLPYNVDGKLIHDAVRVIREEEPSRLSSVNRIFRGDVETIVAKALEKEKDRRYQSASELAADIRRYLADQPIVARPASTWYHVRKFAKRNRTVVTSTVVLFVILVSALVAVTSSLSVASRDRDVARRQATIAQAVNDFLNDDLLAAVDPRRTADRELTMREVLDAASERIDGKFPGEPLVEAAIRLTLGETYIHLSEYDAAEPHLSRALQLRRDAEAPAIEIADAQLMLGMVMLDLGRFDDAETQLARCLETCRAVVGVTDTRTLDAMNNLAAAYYRQERYEEAEAMYVEAVQIGRTHHARHEATLGAMASLALLRQRLLRLDEAEPLSVEAAQAYQEVLGSHHPYTLTAKNNLAMLYSELDRFDEAERLFLEVLDIRLATLGEKHSDTLVSRGMLARAYREAGRFAEAEASGSEAYDGLVETLGPDHPYVRVMIGIMSNIYRDWGKQQQMELWQSRLDAFDKRESKTPE